MNKASLYHLNQIREPNGCLSFIELPFESKRMFHINCVPIGDLRGKHAHRTCQQLLFCLNGSVEIKCDNGKEVEAFTLRSYENSALYIPPMIWSEQVYLEKDSTLLCLASHSFSESDYIRDYEEFRRSL